MIQVVADRLISGMLLSPHFKLYIGLQLCLDKVVLTSHNNLGKQNL